MTNKIKHLAKRMIAYSLNWLCKTSSGRYACQQIVAAVMNRKRTVHYHAQRLIFTAPNRLCDYRINTFASKEPETLEWIDSMPPGSVLWDIGANIGLYAIYAAQARKCLVYAFEPSVFNLELLARNIFLNQLQKQVTIVPVALSDRVAPNAFKMTTTAWGGALSTFGRDFDSNGAPLKDIFEYQTIGVSMMDAVKLLQLPQPQFIKIDVDGIEHFILRGGAGVLAKVESVLIEIDDNFLRQAEDSARYLKNAGLSLHRKCELGVSGIYNQWWLRSVARKERIH